MKKIKIIDNALYTFFENCEDDKSKELLANLLVGVPLKATTTYNRTLDNVNLVEDLELNGENEKREF
ncbi:hypothetical protein A0H77_19585 [Vibrio alginolyticus]|uniref:hypothetical protein n=1 Tax=Vibrio alginolyticus TaxID=663 RepID=UPI000798445B|nr:hypothetical protein [Vibrio alginolyticus]KXZ35101.1 hypothetical protein A0H77_19585 [Vibrio alginolyticus]